MWIFLLYEWHLHNISQCFWTVIIGIFPAVLFHIFRKHFTSIVLLFLSSSKKTYTLFRVASKRRRNERKGADKRELSEKRDKANTCTQVRILLVVYVVHILWKCTVHLSKFMNEWRKNLRKMFIHPCWRTAPYFKVKSVQRAEQKDKNGIPCYLI